MGPGDLSAVLKNLNYKDDERIIVGFRESDDAGAVRVGSEIVLQTVDIVTPVVDDPYIFGQIAAANALSDIYAMGGSPVSVLNISCFPVDCLDISILSDILEGGRSKIEESGAVVVGGHTVIDKEIKYGLSVLGSPGKNIYRNSMAGQGLDIILTKPLGGGVLSTALKADMLSETCRKEMIGHMTRLNLYALEAAVTSGGAVTMTDVTGFGLLGHLLEVADASKLTVVLHRAQVPYMAGVQDLFGSGLVPEGAYRNSSYVSPHTDADREAILQLTCPETSGGLLIFAEKTRSRKMLDTVRNAGDLSAAIIGETRPFSGKQIIAD